MNIKRELLTINRYSRPGRDISGIKAIVIHWVGNPGTTEAQNRNFFESLRKQKDAVSVRYASAHFIVGLQGEITQCIPTTEVAYHTGAYQYTPYAIRELGSYPNDCTIGIELCHLDASGKFTEAAWSAAVELAATLCRQNQLDPRQALWRHFDITGKLCPKWMVEHPDDWEKFKCDVQAMVAKYRKEGEGNGV